jgi:hypothetical protein
MNSAGRNFIHQTSCSPFTGGNAVFHARAIYSLYNSHVVFNDEINCDTQTSPERIQEVVKLKPTAIIYPNPAKDEATLVIKMDDDITGEFRLFNATGQFILAFPLKSQHSN